jgi:hypothetical protein
LKDEAIADSQYVGYDNDTTEKLTSIVNEIDATLRGILAINIIEIILVP